MDLIEPTIRPAGGNSYAVSHGDDSNLLVEFSNEAVHLEYESEKQGRAVFENVPHIRIRFPGDRNREIFRRVRFTTDEANPHFPDPQRFPRQWAAFKANEEQLPNGTPLAAWGVLNKAVIAELNMLGVLTVEQLATLSDSSAEKLGLGWRDWRNKAQAFLARSESQDALLEKIQQLEAQVAAMQQAPKRGRPRKDEKELDDGTEVQIDG